MINLGRVIPLILAKLDKRGKTEPISRLRWNRQLALETTNAIDAAHRYFVFTFCFPLWHRDQCYAELINAKRIRFTAIGGANERRVSAYQKGFRSLAWKKKYKADSVDLPVAETTELQTALLTCKPAGLLGFNYPIPIDCWTLLYKFYVDRLIRLFSRNLSLNLGSYTLGEFAQIYAAILAISATHEHLSFRWSQNHRFPIESAVLVKSRADWIRSCSKLCLLSPEKVEVALHDLSYGSTKPLDLHIHPFTPLNSSSTILGLAPHFALHSRADENILRICSLVKKDIFDAASLLKEEELREGLLSVMPTAFVSRGPVKLPPPLPDLDMIIVDNNSSTLVICELKWIRKHFGPLEKIDRDDDCKKGFRQLKKIKDFLTNEPRHLINLKVLDHAISEFKHVYYVLLARDHFLWIDPQDGLSLLEYEHFKDVLTDCQDLNSGMAQLLQYEWLPIENRDFIVRYEYAISNGVILDSEIFYPAGKGQDLIFNKSPESHRLTSMPG